jgi:hypothetical protein
MLSNEEERKQLEAFKRSKSDKKILKDATFSTVMGTTTAVPKQVEFNDTDELDKFADISSNIIKIQSNKRGGKVPRKSQEEIEAMSN